MSLEGDQQRLFAATTLTGCRVGQGGEHSALGADYLQLFGAGKVTGQLAPGQHDGTVGCWRHHQTMFCIHWGMSPLVSGSLACIIKALPWLRQSTTL